MLNHGVQPAPSLPRRATIKADKNCWPPIALRSLVCKRYVPQAAHHHTTQHQGGMNVNFILFKACLKECVEAPFVVYTCYATCICTVVEHLHGGPH